MNEPTVSPCWLPVGENHAGARGIEMQHRRQGRQFGAERAATSMSGAAVGVWATKIWRLVHWSCSRLSEPSARAFLGMDAAVKVLEVVDWLSWTSSARGGDLDAGHCPPCCSEALADNRMPPAPLGQVCLAVGWQLLQVPVGARFSPHHALGSIIPPQHGHLVITIVDVIPSPVPPKLIDPLAPRRDTLRQFFSPSKPPLQDLQIPEE
ncbi:hypothetical protein ACCO45_004824 [Purpureocillium lilacinum]|uniref:Uncharacterized protein n=1 Tax=Purpureocillium lilacinum TaxID=33203 RepID=A0ACC4DTP0_PURLI